MLVQFGQATVPDQGRAVNLGHHQRHVGFHAERARLVDDDGAGLHGLRRVLARLLRAGREQGDVDALEGVWADYFDGDLLAPESDRLAEGALRGEHPEARDGEIPLRQQLESRLSDGAGDADHGHAISLRHDYSRKQVSPRPWAYRS